MNGRLIAALLAFFTAISASASAGAQILATNNIEQLCRDAPSVTHRRTLVYVDLSSISKAKKEWGLTILNRLELAPREFLTVLSVNPNTFEINQVFETCYPTLTKSEIDAGRGRRGLWDKLTNLDPMDQQRENLQTFDARLKNSLDKLLAEAAKYEPGKRRNVLGAVAFDKNRFSDRSALYRVVIHSDGSIVDPDVELSADVGRQVAALTARYPASFFGAEVLLFGISEGSDSTSNMQFRERVFSAFFLNSWAHLKSFSSSLPQQRNDLFPGMVRWEGTFEGGGTQGGTRLIYTIPNGGNLSEGWLAFVVGRTQLFVPFEGNMQCDGDQCKLTATCTETVPLLSNTPYFRKGDRLVLQGKKGGGFEGTLVAEVREVFKDGNLEVKYTLRFPRP